MHFLDRCRPPTRQFSSTCRPIVRSRQSSPILLTDCLYPSAGSTRLRSRSQDMGFLRWGAGTHRATYRREPSLALVDLYCFILWRLARAASNSRSLKIVILAECSLTLSNSNIAMTMGRLYFEPLLESEALVKPNPIWYQGDFSSNIKLKI